MSLVEEADIGIILQITLPFFCFEEQLPIAITNRKAELEIDLSKTTDLEIALYSSGLFLGIS
jgi:hypothetical protein